MEDFKFTISKFLKRTALVLVFLLAVLFVFAPSFSLAQVNTGIEFGAYTGLAQTDVRIIIAKIIRVFFGVLGIIAVGFTLYGGYMYMTSEGNEKKLETAKAILKNMAIGLAIILSALAIVQFVLNTLLNEYQAGPTGETTPPIGGETVCADCGFLGSVIESHYPGRGAMGIPRNTKIVITFKYDILAGSLIQDSNNNGQFGDTLGGGNNDRPSAAFKIYPTTGGESAAMAPNQFDVFLSVDKRTFIFKPKVLLGSALQDTNYTVKLTDAVKLADGSSAFGAIGAYSWGFTVSTVADLTPPQIESIIPTPSLDKYARNIMVQINFNEPVDPLSASGFFELASGDPTKNFQNINLAIDEGTKPLISGNFKITNQYRTVEFKTADECGHNPCGQTIYCLPGDKQILATVKSASVDSSNKPQAQITANFYDGVVDMAGNSLNGGGELRINGQNKIVLEPGVKTLNQWQAASGKILDDFSWRFLTSAILDTTAPKLTVITPGSLAEKIDVAAPLNMAFDKPMAIGSFKEIVLKTNKDFNINYTYFGTSYDALGQKVILPTQKAVRTTAEIAHGDFWQKSPTAPADTESAIYYPFAPSLLNDIYQNCFYPAVLQNSPRCVVGDISESNKLNDNTPSCFDLQNTNYEGYCSMGEPCPLVPAPHNP